jgi:hypothetical protein
VGRLRGVIQGIAVFGGLFLLLGPDWHWAWRGALAFLLVGVGLVEIAVVLRAMRSDEAGGRQLVEVSLAAAAVLAGVIVTDSWRWVAAGAWVVGVVAVFAELWPIREEEVSD